MNVSYATPAWAVTNGDCGRIKVPPHPINKATSRVVRAPQITKKLPIYHSWFDILFSPKA